MAVEGGIVKGRDAGTSGFSGAKNVALAKPRRESGVEIKARVKEEFAERREHLEAEIKQLKRKKIKTDLKDQSVIEQKILRATKDLEGLPSEETAEILRQQKESKTIEKPSSVHKPEAKFPPAEFPSPNFKTAEAPEVGSHTPKFPTVVSRTPEFSTVGAPTPKSLEEEKPKVEESKVEESKVEESKVEESKVEESKVEESKVEESKAEESVEAPAIGDKNVEELSPGLPPKLGSQEPEFIVVENFEWKPVVREVRRHIEKGFPNTKKIIANIAKKLDGGKPMGMVFDEFREANDEAVIKVPRSFLQDKKRDLWFLGDIHGDYLGMRAAVNYAHAQSKSEGREATLFYLGDLFDRGPHGHLVMLEFFRQVLDKSLAVGMVLGNHDEGLVATQAGGFQGMVDPAEFIDWLNAEGNEEWHGLGMACVEFFKRVPRAVFLPDGLMISHGGVPHEDCQEAGLDWDKLNRDPHCLQDFTWARMHESKKLSFPNRSSKGHQVGREAFYSFCHEAAKIVGHPVERLLRGHDHFVNGHKWYDQYDQKSVLTLNTRCFHPDLRQSTSQQLALARWVEGRLPEVHQLAVPEEALQEVYPEID